MFFPSFARAESMVRRLRLCLPLLALLLAVPATSAYAWGTRGHQVVANVAYANLTHKARADVDRLLALEPDTTLASISTWADVNRDETTARWHFVNFPRGSCAYDARRDCPDGQCVVEAINAQLVVLASNTSDKKRLTALKFVVHLVADGTSRCTRVTRTTGVATCTRCRHLETEQTCTRCGTRV